MNRALAIIRGLVRPPFAVLLGLDAALGMAQTGHFPRVAVQIAVIVAVMAWMLFSVAVNDLADEAVDAVNLADDAHRVLVSGRATRRDLIVIAGASAAVALATAQFLGAVSLVVIGAGLALAAAYSLPPFRLSARGALTSVLLPLGYVAVPYLVGAFSSGAAQLHPVLLVGVYLGFMGRLVLKDFRDERGDHLYGKRTLLVRHGRNRTLLFSAVFWSAGAVVALGGLPRQWSTAAAMTAYVAVTLVLLADIARDDHGGRDAANIAAIAMIGRAFLYTVLIQIVTTNAGWSPLGRTIVVIGAAVASLGMAWECRTELLDAPATRPAVSAAIAGTGAVA